ncbi:MAG TPA: DUF1549 domain-containing protein [Tepidisphaeraceae bacterium]|nr:DUF1549 domain-containing protein [Tepidisphaeraceae bacterium]
MNLWSTYVAIVVLALAAPAALAESQPPIDFNRDIRPILSENCYACHGPDKAKRKADMRLDTKDGLFSTPDEVTIVVPGKPADSALLQRIAAEDEDDVMPPRKTDKRLTPAQIALIKRWIEEGAQWKGHWSYIAPTKPEIPAVADDGFAKNDIDRFVLAGLKSAGLTPSPEADRVTLLRRLSFDITGLPPTPEEVAKFVDGTSTSAYDEAVERLLASPHYGERMAVYWLDLVRYADTVGYHGDQPRQISPYRDYVIHAFNTNKPFDAFTIEQLAGDLLPQATIEQKIASGYNRLLQTTGEGGAQAKEYVAKYAADRVRNASSVWLGATMACCECHDHKYDPFSQKDFYTFAAFLADVQEIPISIPEPELMLPDEKQSAELARLDHQIRTLKQTLDTPTPELVAAQARWERSLAAEDKTPWTMLLPSDASAENGTTLVIKDDKSVLATGANPETETFTVTATTTLKDITAIRLEALPLASLPSKSPSPPHQLLRRSQSRCRTPPHPSSRPLMPNPFRSRSTPPPTPSTGKTATPSMAGRFSPALASAATPCLRLSSRWGTAHR